MKNKGKFLFSDVDGTLMTEDGNISDKNIIAIKSFIAQGGQFGIATGRGKFSGKRLAKELGANAPCIIYNGAVVYDFLEDRVISIHYLPESGRELAKASKERFPDIRISVATLKENVEVGAVVDLPPNLDFQPRYGDFDSIEHPWIKVVYHIPTAMMPIVTAFLRENASSDLAITVSGDHYVEILPAQSNKGTALTGFKELNPELCIYAIGDYHNDTEMLLAADVSACPAQALDEIKAISRYVVSHVSEGAVADYISIIEDDER